MNQGLAMLLAILGGAILSAFLTIGLVVGLTSLLWIFVFGDDIWPAWVRPGLDAAIPVLGLLFWAVAARVIWMHLTVPPRAG